MLAFGSRKARIISPEQANEAFKCFSKKVKIKVYNQISTKSEDEFEEPYPVLPEHWAGLKLFLLIQLHAGLSMWKVSGMGVLTGLDWVQVEPILRLLNKQPKKQAVKIFSLLANLVSQRLREKNNGR